MIRLSEKELHTVLKDSWGIGVGDINNPQFIMVAVDAINAQLKKLIDEAVKSGIIRIKDNDIQIIPGHQYEFWQELLKEVNE